MCVWLQMLDEGVCVCVCAYVCVGNVGVCVCIPPLNNCVHTEPMGSGCSRLNIFCSLSLSALPLLPSFAFSRTPCKQQQHLFPSSTPPPRCTPTDTTCTTHAHAHKHACYTTESHRQTDTFQTHSTHIPDTFHRHTGLHTDTHTQTHVDTRTDTTHAHAHHITSHHITSHHITNANHHAGNTTTQQRVHQSQVPAPDIQGD